MAGLATATHIGDVGAVTPRALVELTDLGGPVVSPDGRWVAYRTERASVEKNTYETAWYVASLVDVSPPRRVADGGTPLRNSSGVPLPPEVVWSPDSRWLHYRARMDGKVEVWRAAVDGSAVLRTTRDPADVRAFRLSEDGNTLHYAVGATRDEVLEADLRDYDAGIRLDATIAVGQGLFRSGYLDEQPATQRLRDNEVIRHPLLANVPDQWLAVDLATGDRRPAVAPSAAHDHRPSVGVPNAWKMALEPGGTRVAVITRTGSADGLRESPDVVLSVVDAARPSTRLICRAPACTGAAITSVQWRPGTREVLYTVSEPDAGYAQSILRWNIETGVVQPVAATHGLIGGGRDRASMCDVSPAAMACVVAEPNRPPRLERIDLASGERRVLHDPNARLAWDTLATPAQAIHWRDGTGMRFTGQFFAPVQARKAPAPLVINYYWCLGYVRGGLGDEIPFAALAAQGIASLCINRAPVRMNAVERYELARSAVESAVTHLASQGLVDRRRVGMGGLSFGTEATLWTAMHSDVLAAASVSSPMISPQLRLLLGLQGEAFEERLDTYWQLGRLDTGDPRWQLMSPLFNLDRFRIPILMQMPEQEYMHVLDYAIPLIRSGHADMYVFPHEPHQKFQPRHKLSVYERNVDWFRFWLQGHEDPDPGKRDQYAHWRVMRQAADRSP
ncbi:Atxe2 family lasso peptide isopeptidase [Luteimonas sp. SDU101]|uniref:Atxe2 family lasso peptide isopeptidase n=1 Tax=Luteimonas sp. SDU101 TaxID=3422593 RepID=UPI003EB934C3